MKRLNLLSGNFLFDDFVHQKKGICTYWFLLPLPIVHSKPDWN